MLMVAVLQEIKGIRSGAKNAMGDAAKNPLGKFVSVIYCSSCEVSRGLTITRLVTPRTISPRTSDKLRVVACGADRGCSVKTGVHDWATGSPDCYGRQYTRTRSGVRRPVILL